MYKAQRIRVIFAILHVCVNLFVRRHHQLELFGRPYPDSGLHEGRVTLHEGSSRD